MSKGPDMSASGITPAEPGMPLDPYVQPGQPGYAQYQQMHPQSPPTMPGSTSQSGLLGQGAFGGYRPSGQQPPGYVRPWQSYGQNKPGCSC